MMKRFFIYLIFILFSSGVVAQPKTEKVIDPNASIISFDKMEYDFGTIYQDSDGNCFFAYTNTGKTPLLLSRVRSSCGCTIPKWSRMPLNPGESDTIKVRYDTKRLGSFHKSITVLSNSGNGSVVLKIKGKVLPKPAEAMPTKNVDFDTSPINK